MSAPYNTTTGNTNFSGQATQQNPNNQGYSDEFSNPNFSGQPTQQSPNNQGYSDEFSNPNSSGQPSQQNRNDQGYNNDSFDPNRNNAGYTTTNTTVHHYHGQQGNQGNSDNFSDPNRNNAGYTGSNTTGHNPLHPNQDNQGHRYDNNAGHTGAHLLGHDAHHHQQDNQGRRDDFSDNRGNALGQTAGLGHGHNAGTAGFTGHTGSGANTTDPRFNNTQGAGGGQLNNDQYPHDTNTAGYPVTTGNNTGSSGAPTSKIISGKLQHAAGTLLGSESMKAKGLAKEQEGQAEKAQGKHLEHAHRLEAQAERSREAAVARGAHPHHGKLGGPGHTGQNFNQDGATTGGMNQPTDAAYGSGGVLQAGNGPTVGGGAFGLQ